MTALREQGRHELSVHGIILRHEDAQRTTVFVEGVDETIIINVVR